MATLTIGTASGGYYNYRGVNATPYAMGSSVVVATTGGDINITAAYDGIVCSQMTFQCAANAGTSTFYGNIWNTSGVSTTVSPGVSAAADTAAPFGSKTFNLSDQYYPRSTLYAGFSRAAADDCNWDVVNGNNTTRVGNTAGSAPSGLTGTGTGTIYRRLVGTLTYTPYDAGNISQSLSQPSNLVARVTFAGSSTTYAKNISVNWGDGTTSTATVAAGVVPTAITKPAAYAAAGLKTVTTTLSHASTSVGIPDIVLTSTITIYTVPGAPTITSATAGNASVAVSWTAPAYVGSGTVNYALYRTPAGGSATLVYNSTSTSFTDTGLANGTSYSYTVYASNTWGTGGVSNTVATTPYTIPSTPSVAATPGNGSISITFSSSSDGGSAIYYYQYSLDNINWSGAVSSPVNITGLTNGTLYTIRVRAVNAAGNSGTGSATATTWNVPGAPTSFGYTSKTESSINLSWSAPSSNGGSAITGYTLYRGATQIYPTLPATSGTATSFNDTGLAFETSYSYSVYAVNAIGSSASPATSTISTDLGGKSVIWNGTQTVGVYPKVWNGSSWITGQSKVWNGTSWVKGLGVTAPSIITNAGINNPSAGTVTYSITPPFNGNSAITGYYVEFWQIGVETDTFLNSSSTVSGTFGYSGADTYAIFAYAINSAGTGQNARFDLNLI